MILTEFLQTQVLKEHKTERPVRLKAGKIISVRFPLSRGERLHKNEK